MTHAKSKIKTKCNRESNCYVQRIAKLIQQVYVAVAVAVDKQHFQILQMKI